MNIHMLFSDSLLHFSHNRDKNRNQFRCFLLKWFEFLFRDNI